MSHLLDTNSWVDHFRRGPTSKVTAKLRATPPESIRLCSLVIGELVYGALHGESARRADNLELIVSLRRRFASLPFDDRAAEE